MVSTYPIFGFAEPISCLTHLTGAAIFLSLSIFQLRRPTQHAVEIVSTAIFAAACVFLLVTSGVYHLLPIGGSARPVLQRLDHAAIYVMIAGTITSVHIVLFKGFWRWGIITAAWIIAAVTITLKLIYFKSFGESLGLASYLAFGWLGIFSGIFVWREYGFRFVRPLLFGGLAYTTGALLDYVRQPVIFSGVFGPHEIFHLAVILGISYHWQFIHAPRRLPCRAAADG